MERIWLKQYPPGMPTEIDASQYPSLVTLLEESFAKYRDRKAFICMDKSITYGDLDDMSRAFGAYLQGTGLKFGDRVAVMMPNVLQYPVVTAGILRAGMTVVNVNPLYTPRELEHQLRDSGAETIVILENFATTLQQVIATGAGASARKSIGITVFTGMIASTCLAVLFVPSLFVVIQRFEEWLKSRKDRENRTAETVAAE